MGEGVLGKSSLSHLWSMASSPEAMNAVNAVTFYTGSIAKQIHNCILTPASALRLMHI